MILRLIISENPIPRRRISPYMADVLASFTRREMTLKQRADALKKGFRAIERQETERQERNLSDE